MPFPPRRHSTSILHRFNKPNQPEPLHPKSSSSASSQEQDNGYTCGYSADCGPYQGGKAEGDAELNELIGAEWRFSGSVTALSDHIILEVVSRYTAEMSTLLCILDPVKTGSRVKWKTCNR